MSWVLVRHTVEDYDHWKPYFEQDGVHREAAGSTGGYVFRNHANPNECFILFEGADLEKLEAFAQDPRLREVMAQGGVIEQPDVWFLDLAFRPDH